MSYGSGVSISLLLKTSGRDLKHLNNTEYTNVPVDIPWIDFLRCRTSVLNDFDPQMYSIKTKNGARHNLLEEISVLMFEYKKRWHRFTLFLVRNVSGEVPLVRSESAARALWNKQRLPRIEQRQDECVEVLKKPNDNHNTSVAWERQRFSEKASRNGGNNWHSMAITNDFDDVESRVSQETQEDLIEAGVDIIDVKPQVLEKMLKSVSNIQMLRIRQEIRTLHSKNSWGKVASKAPQVGNLMMTIFFPELLK